MLLDFQMPIKNAIEAIQELRKFFRFTIENEEDFEILEPTYVILTAFATPQFKNYLKKVQIDICYEKPM